MYRSAIVALLACAALAPQIACAQDEPVSVPDNGALPPWLAAYEPQDEDEKGLWQLVDELEKKLQYSKEIVRDPDLNEYVRGVLCETVGYDRCSATRIYILRDANFNAGMYPNGMMVVNTGLLLRMRNEAELASVLGHEFGHFENRHTLKGFKRAKSGSDLAVWGSILLGVDLSGIFLSNLFAHSREMEKEADLIASRYLSVSTYPSSASAQIWLRLIDEDDARAEERKRRKRNRHTSWFASHPAPLARAEYLTLAAETANDHGDLQAERYRDRMGAHLLAFFDDQLQRNDFAASQYLLEEIAEGAWLPLHYIMQGELYRKRGNPRDLVTAEESYRKALESPERDPVALRGLGLVLLRQGKDEEGTSLLSEYLAAVPDAVDQKMISLLVKGTQQ